MLHRNRFVNYVLIASFAAVSFFAVIAWIEYSIIPTNLAIARDAITSIEEDYKATGEYANSVAHAEAKNCWGQPIKIILVKVGSPSNAIDVTVVSPGPLGLIGVASVTKIIDAK